MSKLSIGKGRAKTAEGKIDKNREREGKTLFVIGCTLVCLMLIPAVSTDRSGGSNYDTAIPVISGAVENREELQSPAKDTSAETKEWSVYDYIGQMFADLLFGDR